MANVRRYAIAAAILGSAVAASGCSNTASNLLSTGSIFGGDKPKVAAAPAVVTPVDRALQVAAVSARAQKCGYVFDPGKLKSDFLAAEAVGGTPVDQLVGLGERYDFTAREVAKRIAGESDYCSDDRTQVIKADLNRHLLGDFSARAQRKQPQAAGLFDGLEQNKTEINPDFGREPYAQPTRKVPN